MDFSSRISSLKPSPTVALNGKAKELIANGVDVCNFAVGESSHTTPKKIVDAAINALNEGKRNTHQLVVPLILERLFLIN